MSAVRIVVADDHQVIRTGYAALLDTQPDFTVVGTASDGGEAVQICRELTPDVVLMDVRMPGVDGIEATRRLCAASGRGGRSGKSGDSGPGWRNGEGASGRSGEGGEVERGRSGGDGGSGRSVEARGGGGGGGERGKNGGSGEGGRSGESGSGRSGGSDEAGGGGGGGGGGSGERGRSGGSGEGGRSGEGGESGKDGPRILILTTFDLDEYVYDALRAGASGFLLKDVTAEQLFDAVRVIAAGEALLAPTVTRRLISEFTRLRPEPATSGSGLSALTPRETQVLRLIAEGLSNTEVAARLVVTEETVKTHVSRVLNKLGLRDRTQAVVAAYESGLVVPRSRS